MSQNDVSTGSVRRHILNMAIPMTLAQLVNVLYNIIDRIYLGHMAGGDPLPLTGVGLCLPVLTVISAFSALYGTGGAPLCSMERGSGNLEEAETLMNTCFRMLVTTGLVLTVIGLLFRRPILYLFGASAETIGYADQYLSIYLIGTVFVMISLGMNYFINAQGYGRMGMATVAIGAFLNLVLDPLFIFVFDLGVRGAAIATVLSQAVSALWVMLFLRSSRVILRLHWVRRLDGSRLRRILSLGLSGFIQYATNGAVQIACNATLQQWGGDLYVGVMTVLSSIREMTQMPVQGMTSGGQPVISYNYGARRSDRVCQSIRFVSITSIVYTTLIWGVLFLFPAPFVRLFSTNASLVTTAIPALHIYFFGFCFMSLQFSGQTTFVALGQSTRAVFFSLFRKVIIVVPLTILLPWVGGLGVMGVFLAEPISNLIGGLACYITMYRTVYRPLRSGQSII